MTNIEQVNWYVQYHRYSNNSGIRARKKKAHRISKRHQRNTLQIFYSTMYIKNICIKRKENYMNIERRFLPVKAIWTIWCLWKIQDPIHLWNPVNYRKYNSPWRCSDFKCMLTADHCFSVGIIIRKHNSRATPRALAVSLQTLKSYSNFHSASQCFVERFGIFRSAPLIVNWFSTVCFFEQEL